MVSPASLARLRCCSLEHKRAVSRSIAAECSGAGKAETRESFVLPFGRGAFAAGGVFAPGGAFAEALTPDIGSEISTVRASRPPCFGHKRG